GAKYSATVDAKRYLALSSAIDRHKPNPEQITTPTYVLAVREDQLVPEASAQRLYERLSGAKKIDVISSVYGHDGFLKETTQVGDAIRRFFDWEAV
ncbi:MAG: alpha/beta hydrolase, partial [Pseudomonadota bacterium]